MQNRSRLEGESFNKQRILSGLVTIGFFAKPLSREEIDAQKKLERDLNRGQVLQSNGDKARIKHQHPTHEMSHDHSSKHPIAYTRAKR